MFTSKWRNWYTHHLEVVAPKGMRVRPPSCSPDVAVMVVVSERLRSRIVTPVFVGSNPIYHPIFEGIDNNP